MTPFAEALRDLTTRYRLRRCAEVGRAVVAHGTIWIHGAGSVRLGARVILDGGAAPIELHVAEGAEIVLDDDVRVEGGVSIEAQRSVRIGARARVGRGCKILDNHFHRVGCRDDRPQSVPVIVEEDAELGARVILLPGAHVGRSTVVRAGTVLGRRVPPEVVVAGMPATLVKA
jgi:acetyltransferase-like isoleucine patch superfamily enzyme